MNYCELKKICHILDRELYAARVEHIADDDQKILLTCRLDYKTTTEIPTKKQEHERENTNSPSSVCLLIDWAPTRLRMHLSKYKIAPHAPQAFTMLLRKYISNQKIRAICIDNADRIVFLEFGNLYQTNHTLVVEFKGKTPNIFLLDNNEIILGALKLENQAEKLDDNSNPRRQIGDKYIRPPLTPRMDIQTSWPEIPEEQLHEFLDTQYSIKEKEEIFQKHLLFLRKACRNRLAKEHKLATNLEADLQRIVDAEILREHADLLAAYAFKIKKGDISVTLDAFDGENKLTIELREDLSPRQNIEALYQKYKKIQKSKPFVEERYLQNQENCEKLLLYLHELDSILTLEEQERLKNIEISIQKSFPKLLLHSQQASSVKSKVVPHLPYRTFYSEKNIPILVGKSAKDNDALTFRYARGNEFWLHVAAGPGSHVIIKSNHPDSETILDAATLALHYAKGLQTQGEVLYVECKYVKRIKGAPLGKVATANPKILTIRMDSQRLNRLIKAE